MKKKFKVAVLPGDAIGPEIMAQALRAFEIIQKKGKAEFEIISGDFGANAYFKHGHAFPEETKAVCDEADAILKGPVGLSHEESQKIPVDEQPERGAILPLRARYNTFANFRPIFLSKEMAHFSPLKPEIIMEGVDILLIRELVGGLYFGEKERGINPNGERYVKENLEYTENEVRQILRVGFEQARKRKKILHTIHKSNVLLSSVFWNEILEEVHKDFQDVTVSHLLVDAAATALCLNPSQFDVMVMENMFGDILSDQGGGILGSLGLMPSACVGPEKSYYEPSHGSAPDIAGKNIANPYSMIGSVAMMFEMSFGLESEALALWQSMRHTFESGFSTADLSKNNSNVEILSTEKFGDKVMSRFESLI
ncbi:MAG: 3-isopropylmalate dehydrogenase [Gammaproteobacteria bacterium]|nr:3-isopropylmalate dehydrogenase [Gammaproteobacteria bacterium]